MHKVFINNHPLIFADIYNESVPSNGLSILSEAEFSLDDVIRRFDNVNNAGVIYLSASPQQTWNRFASRYVISEAAGGVVRNDANEILVIFRKKVWDLPKGKLDYNESPESAAVREVKEECGLKEVELGKFFIDSFHTYSEKNKFILKKTHWYTMHAPGDQELIAQAEEEIEKVRWMSKEKVIEKVYPKTYLSIKDVFEAYFKINP